MFDRNLHKICGNTHNRSTGIENYNIGTVIEIYNS